MDVEVVALSPLQHMTMKRLFLNVLSGDPQFLTCNRAALKELGVPERFLIERGWAIRGAKLHFTQSQDRARSHLQELLPVAEAACAASVQLSPSASSPELMERIKAAMAREEKVCSSCLLSFMSQKNQSASWLVVVSVRVPLFSQ